MVHRYILETHLHGRVASTFSPSRAMRFKRNYANQFSNGDITLRRVRVAFDKSDTRCRGELTAHLSRYTALVIPLRLFLRCLSTTSWLGGDPLQLVASRNDTPPAELPSSCWAEASLYIWPWLWQLATKFPIISDMSKFIIKSRFFGTKL